jgi:hypothetical protein
MVSLKIDPIPIAAQYVASCGESTVYGRYIGKYLSSLRKLDHIIAPKEGFEAQL